MDIDPAKPSKPIQNKRQQAPVSVIQLESDNESSAPSPVKKRKQKDDRLKDCPPKSTAVKRQRKNNSNPALRNDED